jgi:hypothetical protein
MRVRAIVALLVKLPGILTAQVERPRIFPAQRVVSLTAGVGNAMGWFGAQGERYFADERLSVFVGLGYTPRWGVGYAVAAPRGVDPWGAQIGFGAGHTWRSTPRTRGPVGR